MTGTLLRRAAKFDIMWGDRLTFSEMRLMLTFRRDFLFALLALLPASLMNAAQTLAAAVPHDPWQADLFEAREFKGADGKVLKYRLLKPIDFDPSRSATEVSAGPLPPWQPANRATTTSGSSIHGGRNFADEAAAASLPRVRGRAAVS